MKENNYFLTFKLTVTDDSITLKHSQSWSKQNVVTI